MKDILNPVNNLKKLCHCERVKRAWQSHGTTQKFLNMYEIATSKPASPRKDEFIYLKLLNRISIY